MLEALRVQLHPERGGKDDLLPAMRPLLAAHGEARIEAAALDVLGFPWTWVQTAGEVRQLKESLGPSQGARS